MTRVEIHGHRGSRGTVPENTIESFAEAALAGAEWVELDVHLSQDNQLVVFHDFEVGGRLLRDQSWDELSRYDCGKTLGQFPSQKPLVGARMPKLEEVILWKKRAAPALRLNVEIKRDPDLSHEPTAREIANQTWETLRSGGLLGESLVQSFDHEVVRELRRMDSQVRLSCLFEQQADFVRIAQECQAQVVALKHTLISSDVARTVQSAGLELLPWTVNHEADWVRLMDLGVRAIITDYPRRLAEFRSHL